MGEGTAVGGGVGEGDAVGVCNGSAVGVCNSLAVGVGAGAGVRVVGEPAVGGAWLTAVAVCAGTAVGVGWIAVVGEGAKTADGVGDAGRGTMNPHVLSNAATARPSANRRVAGRLSALLLRARMPVREDGGRRAGTFRAMQLRCSESVA